MPDILGPHQPDQPDPETQQRIQQINDAVSLITSRTDDREITRIVQDMQREWQHDLVRLKVMFEWAKALREEVARTIEAKEEYRILMDAIEDGDTSYTPLAEYLETVGETLDDEWTNELIDNIADRYGLTWLEATGVMAAMSEAWDDDSLRDHWRGEVADALRQIADQIERFRIEKRTG